MTDVDAIAQKLLKLSEEELTAEVGARAQNIEADPSAGDLEALEAEPRAASRASFDDLRKLGQNVFGPASSGAYKVLCSPVGGNSDLAKELDSLMTQKTSEAAAKATALLAPILVGQLALPQSLAVVVGALLVKKLSKGAGDFICNNWKKNIESAGGTVNSPESTPIDDSIPSQSTSPEASETSTT
jgi:hypothetical protein